MRHVKHDLYKLAVQTSEYFKEWTFFEKSWILIFTSINLYLFFVWEDTWIGLVASLTGMLCVVLTAKARISSFSYGIVNIFAYSYLAYRSAYYGDVMLNILYFLPMSFVGIYYWKRNNQTNTQSEQAKHVVVTSLSLKNKILWFAISLISITVYGIFLMYLNGTLPFIDSSTTVFSIVATILLTKRLTDQWIYWIMVDVLSIIMWLHIFLTTGGDVSILVMWSAFLINAIYGYHNWRKMEGEQHGK
jgi:nicotinamide mononucleotide transporter